MGFIATDHYLTIVVVTGHLQQRVCEGKTMRIKCAKGVINVLKASYGRQHGKEVCPSSDIGTHNCHAVNSLPKMKEECEGKSWCIVPSTNSHFGDPCVGTHKYLTVQYVCKVVTTLKPACSLKAKTGQYLVTTKCSIAACSNAKPGQQYSGAAPKGKTKCPVKACANKLANIGQYYTSGCTLKTCADKPKAGQYYTTGCNIGRYGKLL